MKLNFVKYQGTGNDFIIINNLSNELKEFSNELVSRLCDRKFGVGADGLILINSHSDVNFEMNYSNADGSKSFCGNGARCAVHFAHQLGLFENKTEFSAIDGIHSAKIINDEVSLKMNDVLEWIKIKNDYIIDTGSPHYIRYVENLADYNIVEFGKQIRYNDEFRKNGINVNLVEKGVDRLKMLTYERGVEDETYSCGTGATAVAIANSIENNLNGDFETLIKVKGGDLTVKGHFDGEKFTTIYLIGPATAVFNGQIEV